MKNANAPQPNRPERPRGDDCLVPWGLGTDSLPLGVMAGNPHFHFAREGRSIAALAVRRAPTLPLVPLRSLLRPHRTIPIARSPLAPTTAHHRSEIVHDEHRGGGVGGSHRCSSSDPLCMIPAITIRPARQGLTEKSHP